MILNLYKYIASALVVSLLLITSASHAQNGYASKVKYGIGATMGMRSHHVKSDFNEINNMQLRQEGGSILVSFGGDVLSTKTNVGYFYSTGSVPHTIHLLELGTSINFHPLKLIPSNKSRFSPYSVVGVSSLSQRFHGFYTTADQGYRNMSAGVAPYIGRIKNVNLDLGLGLEYQLLGHQQFVCFFLEAYQAFGLTSNSRNVLEHTSVLETKGVKLGMRFGLIRH